MPLKSLKHTIMTNYMRVMNHFDSLTILNQKTQTHVKKVILNAECRR